MRRLALARLGGGLPLQEGGLALEHHGSLDVRHARLQPLLNLPLNLLLRRLKGGMLGPYEATSPEAEQARAWILDFGFGSWTLAAAVG